MDIKDHSGYMIYDDGRVWSKRSKKFLSDHRTNTNGYIIRALCKDYQMKQITAHRLVATHYIPNPENLPQIDHIDRNIKNNHVTNLRWCTHSQNMQNTKRKPNSSGVKNIYKHGCGYQFIKKHEGIYHSKKFDTLEEAIQYKDDYTRALGCKFLLK